MCDADVGLMPMYWVQNHDHPWPDFSTTHKCRNFDAILDWVDKNQVVVPKGFKMVKPSDAFELQSPP